MSRKNKKSSSSKIALALLIIIILLVVAIPFISERFFKNDIKGNEINENNIEQKEKNETQEIEKIEKKKQEKKPDIYTGKYEQTKQETPKTKAQVEENYKKQQSNTVPNWTQNDYDNAKKAEDIVKAEVKNYNSYGDFFTVDLYKNSNLVRMGEKVVYGLPLFDNYLYLDIPKVVILPYDTTGNAIRISYENLNEDVFLYVG